MLYSKVSFFLCATYILEEVFVRSVFLTNEEKYIKNVPLKYAIIVREVERS